MAEQIGKQLGNYRLMRLLGRGGFSDVYLGEHVYLKTQAAIKVLRTQLTEDDLKDFLNEARIVASLKHPHIVRVLEFGVEDDASIYLVMDYAPNGTLRQRYPKGARLAPSIILPYVQQVADALQYAHDQKLIHRDVKPENMLLGNNDEVLLSDFGVAAISQNTHSLDKQEIVGTLAYIAPEQLQGKPRLASDQYALGIVVYEWLTGERPFQGSAYEIASQHMLTPPPPLHEKVASIAPAIEDVVLKALEKDPYRRFASVQAFARALEQVCASTEQELCLPPGVITPGDDETIVAIRKPPPIREPITPAYSDRSTTDSTLLVYPPRPVQPSADQTFATIPILHEPSSQSSFATRRMDYIKYPQAPVLSPQAGTTVTICRGHTDWVRAVAWSPDNGGEHIASASNDKTIVVWNVKTGSKVITFRGHTDAVYSVGWSPDGKYIASAGADRSIRIWDVATGQQVLTYLHHADEVYAVAWSPKGPYIASASVDRTVHVWDAKTGDRVATYTGHTDWVRAVAWSPDGMCIASAGNDKTVQVWHATTGEKVLSCCGHLDWVRAVAWSPDGNYIISASNDKTVQVWNATTVAKVSTYYGHRDSWLGGVLSVMWIPDRSQSLIASAGEDQTVQLWSIFSAKKAFTYTKHSAPVAAVAWSPDGKYIASGSHDKTVQIWQAC